MTSNFQLVKIYDLREWMPEVGYLPIPNDAKNTCQKCHKLHAKVFVVERISDQERFEVGSGCCKKAFDWEPDEKEVKRLEKEATKLVKSKGEQKRQDQANAIAEQVFALPLPKIVLLEKHTTMSGDTVSTYGIENSKAQVQCYEASLPSESRQYCLYSWQKEQANKLIEQQDLPIKVKWDMQSRVAKLLSN